ncbi:alpha/beta fold hydrolase [Lysinibacillus halotolerans]|nr:alpha/beta fold hydrolase [Ureibacillus galli]MBD8026956.1 alpha/beta fold hydrolase [Ureibacillus galli]
MLQYIRKGTGEVLVLVHGFLGAKEIFQDVIEDLSSHYDVIAVDLPGHGSSKLEKDRYTVYDYAQAVTEVLQHEGVTEATWLGHSLGGYIVLAALEGKVAPIKRAILAYSYHGADNEEQKEKRTKQQQQIPLIGVEPFVDQLIGAFFSNNAKEEQIQFARQIGYRASEEGLIVALEAMKSRPNQQNFVDNTTMPILVIEGSEDGIVQPIQTKNENVEKVITKTGHLGMLEDPKSFTEAVKQFM